MDRIKRDISSEMLPIKTFTLIIVAKSENLLWFQLEERKLFRNERWILLQDSNAKQERQERQERQELGNVLKHFLANKNLNVFFFQILKWNAKKKKNKCSREKT